MVEYKPLEQRVREELEAARVRDAAYIKARRAMLWINALIGAGGGLVIALLPAIQGAIDAKAAAALVLASAACLLCTSLFRTEVLVSMIAYPVVMVPLAVSMRFKGWIRCDEGVAFAMVMMILVGMSCAYFFGWVRSQSYDE